MTIKLSRINKLKESPYMYWKIRMPVKDRKYFLSYNAVNDSTYAQLCIGPDASIGIKVKRLNDYEVAIEASWCYRGNREVILVDKRDFYRRVKFKLQNCKKAVKI